MQYTGASSYWMRVHERLLIISTSKDSSTVGSVQDPNAGSAAVSHCLQIVGNREAIRGMVYLVPKHQASTRSDGVYIL